MGVELSKDFELPATYRTLFGEVQSSLQQETKLEGYTVRAQAVRSGLVSTASVTGADGRYRILLPDSADLQFLVEAIPHRPAGCRATGGSGRLCRSGSAA